MLITSFEKCLSGAKKIPKEKLDEACEIIQEDGLCDFLDFCIECGCFPEAQRGLLLESIKLYDADPEENYWEEDRDKLAALYEAVGVTQDVFWEHTHPEECYGPDGDDDGEPFDDGDCPEYRDGMRRCPSATAGDYSPSCPWNAPGMSVKDFI